MPNINLSATVDDASTPADPDAALVDRARAACQFLSGALDALPDPGDERSPNERDRIDTLKGTYLSHRTATEMAMIRMEQCAKALQPLEWWAALQKAGIADLERMLVQLETMPAGERVSWRVIDEVKATIRIFKDGPVTDGGEQQTELLSNWFSSHGVKPAHGRFYDGRGGLESTLARIEQAQKELADARATLAARVDAIENLMSVPSGTPVSK